MSECQNCHVCDDADKTLRDFICGLNNVETSEHRVESQKNKCKFGKDGVCCKLCANGPCRITPKSPRGICGADADTIVARNFLRAVAAGTACYVHVVETTARNLKALGENKKPIKGMYTLNKLANMFKIDEKDDHKKAVMIADRVLSDLYKPRFEKAELVSEIAYAPRLKKWQELNILPGGAKSEVFDAIVKTSTNLNSDPVDMTVNCLTLGISTGLYGLTLTNLLNDVILGEPVIRQANVGFKVVDPDYINIMITGHQHSVIEHLQERLIDEDITKKAQAIGAKGFKLVGCTCVGQDLQLRGEHYKEVFSGHAGNNFTSEALIATGGIDLIMSEFNCTLPGIEPIAEEFEVKMICVDDVAKKKNADFIKYSYEERENITDSIIEEALKSYENRRKDVTINIPKDHGYDDVVTGVSEKSLKDFLGGTWKPLVDLIASGKIKGVAGVVGCSNLTAKGHDVFTVELTKELIKRNIIVLSAGCSSGGLENVGLMSPSAADLAGDSLKEVCKSLGIPPVLNFGPCLAIGRLEIVATELAEYLGIDIPQLPLVLSAPQWLEEQALADGAFGLSLGLPLHLAISPFIDGSAVVSKLLKEDLTDITGGKLIIEEDVIKAADKLEREIIDRREKLGLN
ncbi:carbon-monoxide dehydrogenase catalytic subunit [Clostridium acetobutylicum]|uniref:Carbon monoxide dehydrogenase n=1 Tax=Clostridium acetobutylicum (strain ATCC 824 / DSM 792 / JCM 1419 / IAM 19013 / LMG 5710 / NBRC 13948 / NRRL B-527 / VKM B-1787 / 2291 / W) TaxID=272562 RepID=Q97MS5_CLOAB|nr:MULTISPECIES: anaerobic carbon-monoxide dehydrogenase catalytic subunit [Clostridium]AAK78101.1 Carbone-monoxide dehydrogenase, beta chain [Clostridium acetobutylicum ATCC 824]ADZ19160.1 Carbone-monoxide dehydrogenase, beta chain [Clostridium acetobutylicum EA 2018]AEI33225.1 Carbone-monoxide dehydrogenase, beta chain [Clostridium acetobutylicum DSM 1731]AWV81837.1 carbon-monoxide dehydrogenase catalytic subunit [Clostridium acetobutylicum]MBC2395384.1 anaerobic carbon-monoxide dehydrogenas